MRPGLLHRVPALHPERLSDDASVAVAELLREGESSPNTQASYRSAFRYWAAWFELRYRASLQLPLPGAVVLQFIVDHARRTTERGLRNELPAPIDAALVSRGVKSRLGPLGLNTIAHRIAVLSKAHRLAGLKNPCQEASVKQLLFRTRRAYARRGERPHKKDPLTRDPLETVLSTCDDSLRGKRDRALLLFAWATGGRRRSEVSTAEMRFLTKAPDGNFSYELAFSKTQQDGADRPENHKPITGTAACSLRTWLDAASITEGPIFRRIRRGGHVGEALTAAAVRDIVKARCALAGVSGDFSAHSLRSGFATEAGRQQVPIADTMAMTGHRSVQTLMGYMRQGALAQSHAARLFDSGKT